MPQIVPFVMTMKASVRRRDHRAGPEVPEWAWYAGLAVMGRNIERGLI